MKQYSPNNINSILLYLIIIYYGSINPSKDQIFNNYVKETTKGKKFLIRNLSKLGFKYFNSYSNFIVINLKSKILKEKIFKSLSSKEILCKNAPNMLAFKNCIRFTLGPIKYMRLIVNILEKFSKE